MSKISAIIRVKNEEKYVGFCIQSILDTFIKPELIIVNDNSTDNSIDIINHFKEDKSIKSNDRRYTDIKIVNIENYTPGKAINLGVKRATEQYILVISAHCKIVNIDIQKTIKNLDENYAIFGNQIPIWNGKRILKRYIWSNFKEKSEINMFSKDENRYFFHNAFSFFTKKTLVDFPFNEILVGKEDRYWANDYISKDNKVVYMPENIVEHYFTENGSTWKNL